MEATHLFVEVRGGVVNGIRIKSEEDLGIVLLHLIDWDNYEEADEQANKQMQNMKEYREAREVL